MDAGGWPSENITATGKSGILFFEAEALPKWR